MAYFQQPFRQIQDIPEDREVLLSPHSAGSINSARRPSIETVYHKPEKSLEVKITERWEQPDAKILSTPTQRYEKIAQQGINEAYLEMRKSYRKSLFVGIGLAVLQVVLASASIAVLDFATGLQIVAIWMTALAGFTFCVLIMITLLSRPQRGLSRKALVWHLSSHILYSVAWLITSAVLVSALVRYKSTNSPRNMARRAFGSKPSKAAGKISDSIDTNGLIPTASATGFVLGLFFVLVAYRTVLLLRHAMI